MELREILIIKNDRLKLFQVDGETLKKLTCVRGNVYQDDPRLRLAKDLPTPDPEIEITPEIQARAEASWRLHSVEQDAGTRAAASIPEPPKPMTFEEQLAHDWRFNLGGIRKEFVSQASYEAYCKAVRDGRAKVCGIS